ncbi:MAG: M48 family metalloprotease [Pseudomonadota bacterium]
MRIPGGVRAVLIGLSILSMTACAAPRSSTPVAEGAAAPAPATVTKRSASDQRIGDENHKKIVAKYGGIYQNARVTDYVNQLGRKLAAVSEQPGEKWTFTVLNSPTVNAFALPGGYVYVTRGLLALANSEAELAGVIGHEIGHVTAGHGALRQERAGIAQLGIGLGAIGLAVLGVDPQLAQGVLQAGQVAAGGVLADYSRSDELAADTLGIRYLARSGYDPYAQADFLESMSASAALDAKMKGRGYNPNQTDFFASHPATGPRTRQAIETARAAGAAIPVGANRNEAAFLKIVDGIAFGDTAEQGFVRGQTFSHPKLGFTYTAPKGFRITNTSSAVLADGPNGARFVLDGARDPGGRLSTYLSRTWVPQIAKSVRVGRLSRVQDRTLNGLPAAVGYLPVEINGRRFNAMLVAVRLGGSLYRMTGFAQPSAGLMPSIEQAAESFRRLSAGEKRTLRETRIDVVTVKRGDTVESLARRMNVDAFALDRFRVLNGLQSGETLRAGQRVKLVQ